MPAGATVYMSAVIEYIVAKVNELSENPAKANKKYTLKYYKSFIIWRTISPRHIMLSVRNDAELNELLKHVHISAGGVLPCIHPSLLKKVKLLPVSQNRQLQMLNYISLNTILFVLWFINKEL